MTSKVKRNDFVLWIAVTTVAVMAASGPARAQVTEYTSQSSFNTAAPTATTFGFDAGGALSPQSNPVTFNGLSFTSETTAADIANNGSPIVFLVAAQVTPTYGVDFLSYQNTQVGIVADISTAGATAIGFQYGSYVPTGGSATLTLSTGDTYTITPSSSLSFIGFTSTSPITSVSVNYPNSFAFDLVSVSVSAVPEPATWAMLLIGIAGMGAMMRGSSRRLAAVTA